MISFNSLNIFIITALKYLNAKSNRRAPSRRFLLPVLSIASRLFFSVSLHIFLETQCFRQYIAAIMDFDPSWACRCCCLLVFNLFSDLSSSVESIPRMCSLFCHSSEYSLGQVDSHPELSPYPCSGMVIISIVFALTVSFCGLTVKFLAALISHPDAGLLNCLLIALLFSIMV